MDILPAEVHYEISLRAPPTETPIAIRGEMSTLVGDDEDGEEDMMEETPMPAAIAIGEKSGLFAKRAPVSPLPERSPRRPLPPATRRSISRSSHDSTTPQPRAQTPIQTPVNSSANTSFKSSKSARSAKGTPHPVKTMSGGSLPRRVLAPSEDEGEDEPAFPPATAPAPRAGAYNPDQTFNFDESSMDLSMSVLGSRGGPRRVPMRQALPRTDPAVAAAARRLALAHSIGRSNKRDESGSERTASPQEERDGMADATFTLDDLRTGRDGRESMSVGERRAERSNGVEELDATVRRTPRRTSPAKPTPTRTIKPRRSTLDQELRRSSIASSIAISATGNASFSMLTGEELPPGMLDDDDDDTRSFAMPLNVPIAEERIVSKFQSLRVVPIVSQA